MIIIIANIYWILLVNVYYNALKETKFQKSYITRPKL